ncbi:SH3 domain-containing protein [Streptomyces sp. NPDC050856]|uniref:SH3 domain-containing protein n=1 Tax=Streptomyces sp. NPDC050856 TaxID=3154939 RepID=UPI003404C029
MRVSTTVRARAGLATAAAVALTGLMTGAGTAEAAGSYISSNSGGANVRTCPNTGCASLGYLSNGSGVSMLCWVDSQWVYPPSSNYASNRWFKVNSAKGQGYVHSSLVAGQTSVGRC